ncbi:Fe-Mn family superoxide dismutase [Undibacterium sp. Rencai35W]|uniref:Fe-Mn family superoxide dismutase n=1 Tax=Undibacterium sp. Rencai35W TaxID=3413046 RepID=UPI003BF336D8
MEMNLRPLAAELSQLKGLSSTLIASHHQNNYTGAVKRLNAIRHQLSQLDWHQTAVFMVNGLKREELIAANSAYLHELYFDVLGGDGVLPSSGLSSALERDFGSVGQWQTEFTALAKAMGGGSGWALLSWSAREGRLLNHWAADHTQLLAGATPVLALDMYEHAYHIDFGAKAAAYVDTFMQNIRWESIYRRYGAAVAADAAVWAIDVAASKQIKPETQIIDVRRAQFFAEGKDMLPGAQWRDPSQVGHWSKELNPSQPVLIYCVHGLDIGRSTALSLRARGFDACFLTGGIEAWRLAGLPLQAKEN